MDVFEVVSPSSENMLETQQKKTESITVQSEDKDLEKKLGIETAVNRLIEASLFIDQKFISVAIITGNTQNPERMFGDGAWMDYLEAREAAKEYGKKELTIDFIIDLQRRLTKRSNPDISGKIRDLTAYAADYNNPQKPVTYTQEQLKAIQANPLLLFKKADGANEDSTTGFIFYPEPQEVMEKLKELCEWFNNAKKEENYDPFKVAALLQQRLIAIHPFGDYNGTTSRILMNWSLENDGEFPSILSNPNDDILTEKEKWISEVKKGSRKFHEIKKRQLRMKNAGIEDIPALFGLEQEQAFYEYILKHINNAPLLIFKDGKLDHKEYEAFVEIFTQEYELFGNLIRANSTINVRQSTRTLSQGGLISQEFMKLASLKTSNPNPELTEFFSDVNIYRGGLCEDPLTDAKICDMFMHYIGVGTGYRAVVESGINATSGRQINPEQIEEAMDYYNKMVAAFFFKKKHPDKKNPYANNQAIKDLNATIQGHVAGNDSVWDSPFASTSVDIGMSRKWAKAIEGRSKNGILFKAKAPKEGVILSFGQDLPSVGKGFQFEREALIVGGLQPSSIFEIEIFDRSVRFGSDPAIIARRTEREGIKGIELEDRTDKFVVKKFYVFNIKTGSFELSAEEQTSIPVKPIQQESPEFKEILPLITEKYIFELKDKIGIHIPEYTHFHPKLILDNIGNYNIINDLGKNYTYEKIIMDNLFTKNEDFIKNVEEIKKK